MTARVSIRASVYRGTEGFSVRGTDWLGRSGQRIFVHTREAAETTKLYLKTGVGAIDFGTAS